MLQADIRRRLGLMAELCQSLAAIPADYLPLPEEIGIARRLLGELGAVVKRWDSARQQGLLKRAPKHGAGRRGG